MGYVVEVDGRSVWEPSRRVAELFLSQVRGIEQVFEISSGLTVPAADEIQVDVPTLREFLNRTVEELTRSAGRQLEALAAGPILLGIELYERCVGGTFTAPAETEAVVDRIRDNVNTDLGR